MFETKHGSGLSESAKCGTGVNSLVTGSVLTFFEHDVKNSRTRNNVLGRVVEKAVYKVFLAGLQTLSCIIIMKQETGYTR